ncbi:cell surface protein [Duncaniella muricolitica]|uniref:cell surface protein n=1 Tax=Duncaniella muricolitica TaxID=2880704 RepID=UPI00244DEF1B|nr:cell surface protein [Duncaniella muricolitica]
MKHWLLVLSAGMMLPACDRDIPMVNLGIDDVYYIRRMCKLDLHPALTGERYEWRVNGSVVSRERDYIFLARDEGDYTVNIRIIDSETPYDFTFDVHVLHEDIEYSPYISRVYEYCPAPGQFINEMPRYEDGDTYESILQKAEESISGTNDIMISLGGYGGYVTFGFDHTVINVPGERDFRIWGNCFYELLQPDKKGGSAEPGIVMVSYDTNCNGLPDDEWYELAGSEYNSPATRHGYSITYFRPDPDRDFVADEDNSLDDIYYIRWADNSGGEGYMAKNIFHNQQYYPRWLEADSLTFGGTLLAPNGHDISGYGTYYVLYSYPWGYVDNHPNEYADLNSFDISWAVDAAGNPVELHGVDFIRVFTGVNQYCGWLGETSTELSRAQDLHIDLPGIPNP